MDKGIFYGVGVGPGDPELLTLKALRIINACPVIATPQTKQGSRLAYDIASGAVDMAGKAILPLFFTMSPDPAEREASYTVAADAVAAHLDAGRDVAMLNLGDPSLFGTHSYIQAILQQRGYRCEVCAGITSFCEAAARLGVSLTSIDKPLHILPAGYGDLEANLRLPGSKVIMKAAGGIGEVKEALRETGRYHSAALAENCSLPGERLCHNLDDAPDNTGYFTTILVKD